MFSWKYTFFIPQWVNDLENIVHIYAYSYTYSCKYEVRQILLVYEKAYSIKFVAGTALSDDKGFADR